MDIQSEKILKSMQNVMKWRAIATILTISVIILIIVIGALSYEIKRLDNEITIWLNVAITMSEESETARYQCENSLKRCERDIEEIWSIAKEECGTK